jgi:hypothetical protein
MRQLSSASEDVALQGPHAAQHTSAEGQRVHNCVVTCFRPSNLTIQHFHPAPHAHTPTRARRTSQYEGWVWRLLRLTHGNPQFVVLVVYFQGTGAPGHGVRGWAAVAWEAAEGLVG